MKLPSTLAEFEKQPTIASQLPIRYPGSRRLCESITADCGGCGETIYDLRGTISPAWDKSTLRAYQVSAVCHCESCDQFTLVNGLILRNLSWYERLFEWIRGNA